MNAQAANGQEPKKKHAKRGRKKRCSQGPAHFLAGATLQERLAELDRAPLSTAIRALHPRAAWMSRDDLHQLAIDVGDRLIGEADGAWIERFIDGGQARPRPTIQLLAIRRAINGAASRLGLAPPKMQIDPRFVVSRRLAELRAQRRQSLLDVSAIRDAASRSGEDGAALALICGETGARLGELVNAEWPQLGLVNGSPTWTIPSSKTVGPPRVLKLTPVATRAFERLAEGADPASPRVFHQFSRAEAAMARFRRFAEREGLGHVRFHDIRVDWRQRTGGV